MTGAADLQMLAGLAQMVLDRALADLRRATARREATQTHMRQIEQAALAPVSTEAAGTMAMGDAHLVWAAAARERLALRLAGEEQEMETCRKAAAHALGRVQALQELAQREVAQRRTA